jgi:hypothetical protein
MQVRENIAAHSHMHGRLLRPRFSGDCSFRDFFGSELRKIDHLVN